MTRPYFAAGWTTSDITHALSYRPSSTSRLPAAPLARIYAPAGWARSRLAAWRDAAGRVLPGEHQRQAALADVRARHGHAGAASLPGDQLALLPEHITGQAHGLPERARETFARNQRREHADRRAGMVPYAQHGPCDPRRSNTTAHPSEDASTGETRAEAMTAIRNSLARTRHGRGAASHHGQPGVANGDTRH
jgi:hypothetical protein